MRGRESKWHDLSVGGHEVVMIIDDGKLYTEVDAFYASLKRMKAKI